MKRRREVKNTQRNDERGIGSYREERKKGRKRKAIKRERKRKKKSSIYGLKIGKRSYKSIERKRERKYTERLKRKGQKKEITPD